MTAFARRVWHGLKYTAVGNDKPLHNAAYLLLFVVCSYWVVDAYVSGERINILTFADAVLTGLLVASSFWEGFRAPLDDRATRAK